MLRSRSATPYLKLEPLGPPPDIDAEAKVPLHSIIATIAATAGYGRVESIVISTERQLEALGVRTGTDRVRMRMVKNSIRGLGFSSAYDKPMGRVDLIRYFSD
jgi:hypothetical protein